VATSGAVRARSTRPKLEQLGKHRQLTQAGIRRRNVAKQGLYANINARKKKGISRPKSKSTVSDKAYAAMKAGFPKKKKKS